MKTEQETETNTPPPTNEETAAGEESRRVRPKWLVPLVAGLCTLALVVAGGIGWKIWSDRRLAEAKAACATASDAARGAMNDWNTLVNGDAADLLEVKADQVKDAKTIDALKTALDVEAPEYEGCAADGKDGLETAIDKLDDAAAWYEKHTGSLKKAVDAVNDSKLAKTIDTAKTLLESSNGNVQDDKTREELSKAIEAKDEAAIAKASKAVNDSIAVKQKADEEAKAKAQAEADAKAAEEAASAATAQTQQQQYNYQQSQPQQSWTPSYSYGGGATGGGSGTTGVPQAAPLVPPTAGASATAAAINLEAVLRAEFARRACAASDLLTCRHETRSIRSGEFFYHSFRYAPVYRFRYFGRYPESCVLGVSLPRGQYLA